MSHTIRVALSVLLLITSALTGCSDQSSLEGYPISADVFTTRQRTVVADPPAGSVAAIYPYEVSKYQEHGYGVWHYGPGVDSGKRLDIMADDYTSAAVTPTARLLNFFAITDIHIVDEESPVVGVYAGYKGGNPSAYSATMLYTTHLLDAAIQTINGIHTQNPIDFGISLGDVSNLSLIHI